MRNAIGIATDSASDIPEALVQKYDIGMIPLRIRFEDHEYRDRFEIDSDEVYKMLSLEIPKSSMPSVEDIYAVWDDIADRGYQELLQVTISSGLSGTYQTFCLCAKEYTRMKVTVYDTKTLSMAQGLMTLRAAEIIEEGGNIAQAIKEMDIIRSDMQACYVVKTLEYLRKGGRIGKIEGAVGQLLHICPIISVNSDGVYFAESRARGYKKAVAYMRDEFQRRFAGQPVRVAVVHGGALQAANELAQELNDIANVKQMYIASVSPVLGAHTGPGLLGIISYAEGLIIGKQKKQKRKHVAKMKAMVRSKSVVWRSSLPEINVKLFRRH